MLTLLFIILMLVVFGKLIGFAIKATWGITQVVFGVILLPLILIGLVIGGFIYVALPVLIVIGVIALIVRD